jgi:hypothetical protein
MPVTSTPTENELLEQALEVVQERLPPGWTAEWTDHQIDGERYRQLDIDGPYGGKRGILVDVKRSLTPKEVKAMVKPDLVRQLRMMAGRTPILVVAPFVGARSQKLLAEHDISYVDPTGNVRIVLSNPGLFVYTTGQDSDPSAVPRPSRGLRGAKAGMIIRTLIDARPPHSVSAIAAAADVVPGYVSRVLETLEGEALITRGPRGQVIDADWQELIRRRAATLDLLAEHTAKRFVSPNGARTTLEDLGSAANQGLVTGSFAAVRYAPVTAPALLVVYPTRPKDLDHLATKLKLRPVQSVPEGADVVLVLPENPGVFRGAKRLENLNIAAPSQVAIDCLSGSGRMPAEGEALIEWMSDTEADPDSWRAPSLEDLPGLPDWARGD